MRVSDQHMLAQYLGNNNYTLSTFMKNQNRVLTQKDFLRASENPIAANNAMKIRKQLRNIEMYDENLKNARDIFTVAETNLYKIGGDLYNTINTKLTSIQSTKGPVEYEAIGEEIMQQAEEMIKVMNADSGGRLLFGGTSSNKQPFTVKYFKTNSEGNVKYFKTDNTPLTDKDGNPLMHYTDPSGNVVIDNETGVPVKLAPRDDGKYYVEGSETPLPDDRLEPAWDYVYAEKQETNRDGFPVYSYTNDNGDEIKYYKAEDDEYYTVDGNVKLYSSEIKDKLEPVIVKTPVEADKDEKGRYVDASGIKPMQASIYDTLKTKKAVVYYNGEEVSKYNDPTKFKGSDGIYIDIGIGIKYDSNGDVIPATAMDISLNGAKLTGCGIDNTDDGYGDSNNIIQLAFDAARAAYNAGDTSTNGMETCNRLIDKLYSAQKTVLSNITEFGVKQNSIEFHLSKDVDYTLNFSEQQNEIEGVDLTAEITNFMASQSAYNAALRMSSTAVPTSIFDFI